MFVEGQYNAANIGNLERVGLGSQLGFLVFTKRRKLSKQ